MDCTYSWQRFWVPRDGIVNLSDDGFLLDPTRYPAQSLHTLADLQHFPALALLGEPGVGKSATLEAEYSALPRLQTHGGHVIIHVNLRSFSSDARLHSRVFESAEFVKWRTGNSHLFLYLDSLDEALLRIDSVAALLADELPQHPTARMSVRIACRTAMWPHEPLENSFRKIWGDDGVGVFELAPLRRKDVTEAAATREIYPERFIEEIQRANAVPFALKPLTLNLLFRIFEKKGRLPDKIGDLYTEGCLSLCEEQSPSRRAARRLGTLNGHQRYRLAARVAATTMLANRYAVWTNPETAGKPAEDVPLSALSTGSEKGDFQPFDVSDESLREVLDTGLFSSRGAGRMGWAHQSYAEFLAADYLVTKGTSSENILKIVCHPSDGGLIPQLSVVAAWVASRSEEVRKSLIAREPFALLRGDLLSWNSNDLAALTSALLSAFEEERAHDFGLGFANDYRKLAYPDLAGQLRPYILDTAKHLIARRNALMIARACALQELQGELLSVALNPSDDLSIRAQAISALGRCGDKASKVQLLPLARGELGPDPNQEMKGHALEILWPDHLTSAELFRLITPPTDRHVGAYVMFLTQRLQKSLSGADLLPALQWATDYVRTADQSGEFWTKQLVDDILLQAWDQVDNPPVMQEFSRYVRTALAHADQMFLADMRRDDDGFRDQVRTDDQKRRDFLLTVLREHEPLKQHEGLSFRRPGLLQESDLLWLLSISPHGAAPIPGTNEQSLSDLIEAAFNINDPTHFESLYDVAGRWPPLRQRYEWLFVGILLESPLAARLREHHRLTLEFNHKKPPPIDPPPSERVRMRLERFEAGDIDAWTGLNLDLTLVPTSRHYDWLKLRITEMPGWVASDEATRRRILNAARHYLNEGQPLIERWLGTSKCRYSDLSAYRALLLLADADREVYDELDAVVWAKWAPVVVAVPKGTGTAEGKFHDAIVANAADKAPQDFARTVQRLIRAERRHSRNQPKASTNQQQPSEGMAFWIIGTLYECLGSEALKEVLYIELRNPNNSPPQFEALLEPLLKAGFKRAGDLALHLLTSRRRNTPKWQPYALGAAAQLIVHCPASSWPIVWKRVIDDQQFGSELFLKIAHRDGLNLNFYAALDEAQLGDLYAWLEQTFRVDSDPHRGSGKAFWAGPRDSVAHVRDAVLTRLVNTGTERSVEELRRVIAQLADRKWLVYRLLAADQIMRARTWTPLSPREVIRVTESPRGRLVQSAQQLADVLVDGLRKYERELHGEQTPVRDLWDVQANKGLRPVDENALSDHVRRFLKRELSESGIILNREVEISRVPGAPIGKRTDIKVDAIRKMENSDTLSIITAVIETKGCWNRDLLSAIKAQLVDDYLVRLGAPVGIYMVGWFDKQQWDAADSRRSRTPDCSVEEAQRRLDVEAAALSQAFIVRATVLDCHAPGS